jgi:hypothetical protein
MAKITILNCWLKLLLNCYLKLIAQITILNCCFKLLTQQVLKKLEVRHRSPSITDKFSRSVIQL